MTCSSPIRRTGPLHALASQIFLAMSGAVFSAVRVMEMAFKAREPLPEIMKRLFAEASQVKTSSVMHSSNRAFTNLTASNVSLESRHGLPSASWTEDPKEYMMARMAILVSISEASPMPTGIIGAPDGQVDGPSHIPFTLFINFVMIDDLFLHIRFGPEKHKQVMPLLGRDLGAGVQIENEASGKGEGISGCRVRCPAPMRLMQYRG